MSRFDSLHAWLNWQEGFHPRAIDLGLSRAALVFQKLNSMSIKKTVTITVAGTNGKGSCVAFLEAIYKAQGYKVGTYTSPHILKYNERIKINGTPVTDELICQAFERIDAARGNTSLSYFEFGTLAALDIFFRSELDIQLLEVGLGGRLDAVNIVDPDAAIITSIDIDHVDWLGETRDAIGREKAGIFRKNTPAIIGDLNPPQSLLDIAQEKQALLFCLNKEFSYEKQPNSWNWQTNEQQYNDLPYPVLKGEHQLRNASVVIFAITQLQNRLPVTEKAIQQGLKNTQLMGRFQLCTENEITILLDVAHNPQAVKTLVEHLKQNFADRKIYAVFAMMKDKDINSVIKLMKNQVHHWFVAPLTNLRAATEDTMQTCFETQGVNQVTMGFESFTEALIAAKQNAKKEDLILIFGSFFLVSEYLANKESFKGADNGNR
jgi:dihydrofolate synthase/folylpolyglutamate synthase